MSEINLNRVLNHPLSEADWPHLETIMYLPPLLSKMMTDYINKCIKNR